MAPRKKLLGASARKRGVQPKSRSTQGRGSQLAPTAEGDAQSATTDQLVAAVLKLLRDSGELQKPPSSDKKSRKPSKKRKLPSPSPSSSSDDTTDSDDSSGEDHHDHTFRVAATPLGSRLPKRIKRNIVKGDYVNFAELLLTNEVQSSDYQIEDSHENNAFKIVSSRRPKAISNIYQWTDAFLIFAAVRSEVYPDEAPGLMKYGKFIRDNSGKGSRKEWLRYDELFRKEKHSHKLPWSQVHWEAYFEIMNTNTPQSASSQSSGSNTSRATSQKPFRDNGHNQSFRGNEDQQQFKQGQCYKFEIHGKCTKESCKYRHSCFKCQGRHSTSKCAASDNKSPRSDPDSNTSKRAR